MLHLPPRLEALLRRDLGATHVEIIADDRLHEPRPLEEGAAPVITAAVPRGRTLVVVLEEGASDRDARQRRLDVLVASFRDLLEEVAGDDANRASPAERLHDELRELSSAAGAADALVIDAQTEVMWGAADADDAQPHVVRGGGAEVIPFDRAARASAPPPPPMSPSDRAVERVRSLPAMSMLARGLTTLAWHDRDGDPPLIARSFAQIYVLVLVFAEPFDELRAERAVQGRLGLVERLVLALPPLDPTPAAGARAVRRRR